MNLKVRVQLFIPFAASPSLAEHINSYLLGCSQQLDSFTTSMLGLFLLNQGLLLYNLDFCVLTRFDNRMVKMGKAHTSNPGIQSHYLKIG